jgi:high-affinity iron transporter
MSLVPSFVKAGAGGVAEMLESFVIVLREGIEAALVVALVVASLRKAGREDLLVRVSQGLVAALAAAIAGGLLLRLLPINEDLVEGILMLVASAFVATMMWWMHREAHRLAGRVASAVTSLGREGGGWSIFWLTFILVGREAVEAVLFLSAAALSSETLATVFGGSLGLVLAVAFGVAFVQGSLRIDLKRFFAVTNFVLGLLLLQLFIGGLHELAEAGLIPVGPREMALIGPIVQNNVLFIAAVLLVPLFALLTSSAKSRIEGSGPEVRLARARQRRESWGLRLAAGLSLVILAVLGAGFVRSEAGRRRTPSEAATLSNGVVRIPLSRIADGRMHRFEVSADGHRVRFLLLKDGARVRSAFDACELCGTVGYNQEGNRVICLNCDATINVSTIGQPGGCNPIPLPSRIEGLEVVVRASDLAAEASRFPAAAPAPTGVAASSESGT